MKKSLPIPVILDTDIGTDIDDTFALIMGLNSPEIDFKLITTATGDTAYRTLLVAKILKECGRMDIPIGTGIFQTWPEEHCNQKSWIGNFTLSQYAGVILKNGVDAIIETVRSSQDPITLLCIGPLTNIGAVLEKAPELAEKCHFVGMFGAIDSGIEGQKPVTPEYNIIKDLSAAKKVFSASWKSATITPLDSCATPLFNGERFKKLMNSNSPRAKVLAENILSWNSQKKWGPGYSLAESLTPYDAVALYMTYAVEFLEFKEMRIGITPSGITCRDPTGKKFKVAMSWRNSEAYLDHLLKRLL